MLVASHLKGDVAVGVVTVDGDAAGASWDEAAVDAVGTPRRTAEQGGGVALGLPVGAPGW